MNIGEASKASDVSVKMVRHYEEIGLLPGVARTRANYRVYSESDVHRREPAHHGCRLFRPGGAELGEEPDQLWGNRATECAQNGASLDKAFGKGFRKGLDRVPEPCSNKLRSQADRCC